MHPCLVLCMATTYLNMNGIYQKTYRGFESWSTDNGTKFGRNYYPLPFKSLNPSPCNRDHCPSDNKQTSISCHNNHQTNLAPLFFQILTSLFFYSINLLYIFFIYLLHRYSPIFLFNRYLLPSRHNKNRSRWRRGPGNSAIDLLQHFSVTYQTVSDIINILISWASFRMLSGETTILWGGKRG